jgi:hypothetical protein
VRTHSRRAGEPGHGQADPGRRRELLIALDGPEHAQRRCHQIDNVGRRHRRSRAVVCSEPPAQHHQQVIEQLELAPGFVGIVTGNIVQDGPELPRDGLGKELGGVALERQYVGADRVERCERSGQALGQQQVVEAVG